MAEIYIRCPQCEKRVGTRGFHGHLRFEHAYGTEAASEVIRRLAEWDPPELRARRADVLEAMEEYAAALRRRQMLDDVGDDLAPEYCIPVLLDELREDADAGVESSRDRVAEVSVSWDCSRTSWEGAEGADLSEDPLYDEKDVPKARKRREARREKLARQLLEIFLKDDDEKSNE